MSNPGLISQSGQQGFSDPKDLYRMQMAQALMGNSTDPRQNNAGLANAGSSILGALQMNKFAQSRDPMAPIQSTAPVIGGGISGWGRRNLPGLFSMGGS